MYTRAGYFPLEPSVCVVWATMDVLLCTASIWHMCTMSLDRYCTLRRRLRKLLTPDVDNVSLLYGVVKQTAPWSVSYTHLTLPTNREV